MSVTIPLNQTLAEESRFNKFQDLIKSKHTSTCTFIKDFGKFTTTFDREGKLMIYSLLNSLHSTFILPESFIIDILYNEDSNVLLVIQPYSVTFLFIDPTFDGKSYKIHPTSYVTHLNTISSYDLLDLDPTNEPGIINDGSISFAHYIDDTLSLYANGTLYFLDINISGTTFFHVSGITSIPLSKSLRYNSSRMTSFVSHKLPKTIQSLHSTSTEEPYIYVFSEEGIVYILDFKGTLLTKCKLNEYSNCILPYKKLQAMTVLPHKSASFLVLKSINLNTDLTQDLSTNYNRISTLESIIKPDQYILKLPDANISTLTSSSPYFFIAFSKVLYIIDTDLLKVIAELPIENIHTIRYFPSFNRIVYSTNKDSHLSCLDTRYSPISSKIVLPQLDL